MANRRRRKQHDPKIKLDSDHLIAKYSFYLSVVFGILGISLFLFPTCVQEVQISGWEQPYAAQCIQSIWVLGQGQAFGIVLGVLAILFFFWGRR